MTLTQEQFDELDNFININVEINGLNIMRSMSIEYTNYCKKLYEKIKKETGPIYYKIGTTSYTTYAIYKSSNQKIYLICVFFQSFESYFTMKDEYLP
jgi:hypothetical protein